MSYRTTILEILKGLKPELISRFGVNSIGVFGSALRDDFSANSDVDVIVDFSKPVGIEFIDLGEFLEKQIRRKIDLVSKSGIKHKYYKEIEPQIVYV
jgi:uncharacterized protein